MNKKVTKDIRMEAFIMGLPLNLFVMWLITGVLGMFISISSVSFLKILILAIVLVVLYFVLRILAAFMQSNNNNDLPPTIKNR